MPKASVKDNHHHRQHGSHQQHHNTPNLNFNGLDNSNRVNSNIGNGNNAPPHLQSKDADKRLKRKLRLQEMRCNLMSNKLTELKTALSNKKRQLKISEKRAKNEEKKRRDEEKKMKDMEKEFHRLRRENDQIKDQINSNRNQTIESTSSTSSPTITSQQPRQQPQASTSSLQPSTPNTSSAPTNSTKKNKKNKQKKTSVTNVEDSPQVRAEAQKSLVNHVPTPITIGSSNNGIVGKLTVTSSNDLKVNEGASCSGVNTSIISSPCSEIVQTDTSQTSSNVINPNDGAHFLGTSKLEDLFENELMCPICHELYIKPIALNCSHIFCHYCIHLWLSKAHKCPICRTLIYEKAPQNVLENVIDKVVSTMDEDSKKRRADVIKDRPPPSENDRISRHGFRRNLISSVLRGDLDDYGRQSTDSLTDSDSYIHSFASPLVYNGFVDRSDSELDYSSDVPNEEMFGLFHDYGYNDDDDDYYDNQDTGSDHDDDDDEDSTDDNGDNYISDGDDDHHEFNPDFYDHPNYGSDSSFESWEANGWRREDSPITIDSESGSDSEESVTYFGQRPGDNSFYSGSNFDQDDEDDEDEEDEEEEDDEDEEDEEEEDEEDEEEENEEYDDEIDEEDGEEDYDNGDDDDVDGEDYYEEEENDSDFDESENSSPWESMDVTESDSDL